MTKCYYCNNAPHGCYECNQAIEPVVPSEYNITTPSTPVMLLSTTPFEVTGTFEAYFPVTPELKAWIEENVIYV